jgi:hypothetical protein
MTTMPSWHGRYWSKSTNKIIAQMMKPMGVSFRNCVPLGGGAGVECARFAELKLAVSCCSKTEQIRSNTQWMRRFCSLCRLVDLSPMCEDEYLKSLKQEHVVQ